jgi:hypothetical protein
MIKSPSTHRGVRYWAAKGWPGGPGLAIVVILRVKAVKLSELLRGAWIEYSGGSRPGTNKIRFCREVDGSVTIEIFYVFDWDTGETENLAFVLTKEEFAVLAAGLFSKGYGVLDSKGEHQDLHFEWRQTAYGFEFLVRGRTELSLTEPMRLEMRNFASVECGALERD